MYLWRNFYVIQFLTNDYLFIFGIILLQEFTNSGVKYEKIMVYGREIPSVDLVNR